MKTHTFRGSPSDVGRAQGSMSPQAALDYLNRLQARSSYDFQNPYFRNNLAFMRREFPDLIQQIQAFGEAAGMESLEHAYHNHLHWTGPAQDACSTLGVLLEADGPAMLSTNDGHMDTAPNTVENTVFSTFPDAKPHPLMGLGSQTHVVLGWAMNDSGLTIGANSGHRRFNSTTNPEHLNLYFVVHLIAQHCSDCDDVRHFVDQYRISGQKGMNIVAIDAAGNMLGVELESQNIAVCEAQDGLLLEVNHWQHPKLRNPSRTANPEWWKGDYYYNSQARVMYLAHYRNIFTRMKTLEELIDFSFDVHAPGRILQMPDRNIGNMVSCQIVFATVKDRRARVYLHPIDKGDYEEFHGNLR